MNRRRTAPHDPSTLDLFEASPPATAVAPARPTADADQREIIRRALDDTLVVEAAAGTGKTTELVGRMVALLEAGKTTLDRMVAVTFTEAAAGELKLRLRAKIEEARLDVTRPQAGRERLRDALPRLEEARIGTIHSFCGDLLREHPVEAGVDPRFDVADEETARPMFDRAFARWFETQLTGPGPGVRRILRRWKREPMFGSRRRDEGPRGLLRYAAWQLVQNRDFPTPWQRATGFVRDPEIDAILDEMERLAEWAERGDAEDWFTKSLLEIARFADEVRRAERVRPRDHDALEARLGTIERGKAGKHWGWKGYARVHGEFPKADLMRRRDELHARLVAFNRAAGADLAPMLRDELWPVVEAYEAIKERTGSLDFDDLLIRARNLVRGSTDIRAGLQDRFTHYFVDEFQDTDPIQAEILLLLASDDPAATSWRDARVVPGKLFLVGDPKQSIYRFRRADVALYDDVQRRLVEQGARLVRLTVSFRSVPAIQDAVNAAFAPRLGGAQDYVALQPHRDGNPAQPALVALPVPAPYSDWKRVTDWRIEESLPDVVAAWIHWLVRDSGWTVTEREKPGERVPVQPRHVCILFRRFRAFDEDVTRPYVAALEARQLPHLLVGGSSFHEREEIEALRNALAAIERPDDDLAVFATLRGPLFAVSDAALLTWREQTHGLHPFRGWPPRLGDRPAALDEVAQSLELLVELHRGRNHRPVSDTIARLLDGTRAHAAFANWPTGPQALANVGRLMDMARRAGQKGLISFRAFVDRLDDDAERGDAGEAPLLEEGVEGVRIMTVHKAKGLEFPVVLLADMTAKDVREPSRYTDPARGLCVQRLAGCAPPELLEHGHSEQEREREEAVRLLYVAATRARDLLVVPVVGDERREGWLAALDAAVFPDPKAPRSVVTRQPAGCPAFGEDSVCERPPGMSRPFGNVAPGEHVPESGSHRVVWWDPAVLELGVKATLGLAQGRILEADEEGRAAHALAAWEAWRAERAATRERASQPTRRVMAATEWARATGPTLESEAVQVLDAGRRAGRPRGPRFGTLVHAILEAIDLAAQVADVASHASVQARILGATDDERDAAAVAVTEALKHPLLARAAAAAARGRCRREVPVMVRQIDGSLLESVADLAFEDDESSGWTVIDWKTDEDLAPRAETYKRQVGIYVRAIAEATGRPARGVLLAV